jgi:uncharacterized protein YycO
MKKRVKLLALFLCLRAAGAFGAELELRDGDIIFQASRSGQSLAIQLATRSPWSHMGVIIFRDDKPFVFEAVNPVKYTPLKEWIARGEGRRYEVMRWGTGLGAEQRRRLKRTASQFVGKPYDLYFEWSDTRIYCSELVWKMYERSLGIEIGRRQKLREFDLTDPRVRAKLTERYGAKIPLDETVISPAAMYNARGLVKVGDG